jgi:hypothetical protein
LSAIWHISLFSSRSLVVFARAAVIVTLTYHHITVIVAWLQSLWHGWYRLATTVLEALISHLWRYKCVSIKVLKTRYHAIPSPGLRKCILSAVKLGFRDILRHVYTRNLKNREIRSIRHKTYLISGIEQDSIHFYYVIKVVPIYFFLSMAVAGGQSAIA